MNGESLDEEFMGGVPSEGMGIIFYQKTPDSIIRTYRIPAYVGHLKDVKPRPQQEMKAVA